MKKKIRILSLIGFVALTALVMMPQFAAEAKQTKYTTGPFTYDPAQAGVATFSGDAGDPVEFEFRICPPGPAAAGVKFPSAETANASIRVFGIEKVADADGNPIPPEDVPLSSPLGQQIVVAFALDLNYYGFLPGVCRDVSGSVANPGDVGEGNYGDYIIVMKAQAPGAGVGVGSGSRFLLKLRPPATVVDTVPPDVFINSPADASSHTLGPIDVSVTACDPTPGTGVVSITAKVSSADGAVTNAPITLTTDNTPKAAGLNATETGTFTPFGGTGSNGTTEGLAFTDADGNRSGIGTYTLTAEAIDGASNVGTATSGFNVNYDVQFTQQKEDGKTKAKFKFTVKRSDSTFMFDQTVIVELIKVSDNSIVNSQAYKPSGDPKDGVIIEYDGTISGNVYHTQFEDLTTNTTYKAKVYFLDVDSNKTLQAESANITTK